MWRLSTGPAGSSAMAVLRNHYAEAAEWHARVRTIADHQAPAHALWGGLPPDLDAGTAQPGEPILLGPRVSKTSWPSSELGGALASGAGQPGWPVPLRACDLRLLSGKNTERNPAACPLQCRWAPVNPLAGRCPIHAVAGADRDRSHTLSAQSTERPAVAWLPWGTVPLVVAGLSWALWHAPVRMLAGARDRAAVRHAAGVYSLRPRRPSPGSLWSRPACLPRRPGAKPNTTWRLRPSMRAAAVAKTISGRSAIAPALKAVAAGSAWASCPRWPSRKRPCRPSRNCPAKPRKILPATPSRDLILAWAAECPLVLPVITTPTVQWAFCLVGSARQGRRGMNGRASWRGTSTSTEH